MIMKVTYPIYEEAEIESVVEEIKKLWKVCQEVKRFYPSTWNAMVAQYFPDYSSSKRISDELFEKKIEVMLMQDEEKRD